MIISSFAQYWRLACLSKDDQANVAKLWRRGFHARAISFVERATAPEVQP